jgi:uncharacterized protein (TIGR00730 family)
MTTSTAEAPSGPLTVCVFAGARSGTDGRAGCAAEELGRLLGAHGHRLVYGGGGSGLMGVVAWAAYRAGADVVGVMPKFLYELERGIDAPPQRFYLTDTMAQRKTEMLGRAEAFVALPGGLGTIDEVLEVLSLAGLSQHGKPLVLLDAGGAWRSLRAALDDACLRGFADLGRCGLHMADDPGAALAAIEGVAVAGGVVC